MTSRAGATLTIRVVVTVFLLSTCASRLFAASPIDSRLQVRAELRSGYASSDSTWRSGDEAWLNDFAGTVRPMFASDLGRVHWELAVEAAAAGGDTIERSAGAAAGFGTSPDLAANTLFDLSRTWSSGLRHRDTLRVDRLALVLSPDWGTITLGRHAVTWGGGLVFNPFDLFNPFAPGDVVRDFKVGSDMLHVDIPSENGGVQLLAVGRRDPASGAVSTNTSSFAAQVHRVAGPVEWFGMAAWHYGEAALGMGLGGTLGGAAWRVDGTWVRVRPDGDLSSKAYVSVVSNIQYSWVMGGRNAFGVLEYYYNGLGRSDAAESLLDPYVRTQVGRGNLFVLGRHQVAASLQLEWHPLLNIYLTAIANPEDGSLYVQPRAVWNTSSTLSVTAGVDVPVGSRGSEYGGAEIGASGATNRSPATGYVFATWDF